MPFFHLTSHQFHLFAFRNKEVNALYFTLGIIHLAEGLIGIFIPIYLLDIDYKIWEIIFFYFLRSAFYLVLLVLVLPALKKMSDKMMIAVSIPFLILFYLGFNYIESYPALFYILPAASALNFIFLYIGYHIDFSGASDNDHVGEEVGARLMINSLISVAMPFTGGILIAFLGFNMTFVLASFLLLLAVLPLFFFPKRHPSHHFNLRDAIKTIKNKALRTYNVSAFGYGSEKMIRLIVWPIFLFIAVGSIEKLGAVISAGFLGGAIVTFMLGKLSDKGKRRKILSFSTGLLSGSWFIRTLLKATPIVVAIHIIEYITRGALLVSWYSQHYKIAAKSEHPGLFILGQQMIYHLSRVIILPILILPAFFFTNESFFTISFIIAGLLSLLFFSANKYHYEATV